ncbi:FecR domain-containing protein [Ochrobactrum sp. S46]|nr:FecR domain-containing protein [Ochrobactrum sp. S45]MBK0044917.1 FecR domain-containing protein [Ochrobactrum sp. S46]
MDAALNWFALLQGYPEDKELKARFGLWLQADPKNAKAFSQIAGVWDLTELDLIAADVGKTVGRVAHLERRRGAVPVRSLRKIWTRAALAAAAVVVLAVGIQQYPAMMLNWRADYQTATGARQDITLPDGSRMTLNTASAISLDFEGGKRSVTLLQGEAYFDVVHDASRPFKVAAAFSEVEVKGTAFSVRSDQDMDKVVLERGLVDVTRLPVKEDKAELHPGESITATATGLSVVSIANAETVLSWRDGRLVFENEPFKQVLQEIGRYYRHSIIVTSDRIGQAKVTGNYRLDNPERTIRSLAATIGATVTRLPGGILILR